MKKNGNQNRYHPLLILLYASGMLSYEERMKIPRSTRERWDLFKHEDYEGYELAQPYIDKFDAVKTIYSRKFMYRSMRFMCSMSGGFKQIGAQFEQENKVRRENARAIVGTIDRMRCQSPLKVSAICKILGLSKDWYYRHREQLRCSKSLLGKCYRQHPNQLTFEEVLLIEQLFADPNNQNKTATTLYWKAQNLGIIRCSLSTFFKYAKRLGYSRKFRKKFAKHRIGFRASRPFEWLHVDITTVQTQEDGFQKVAFVKDNYSSALLHYKSTSGKAGSAFIQELFKETFEKHQLLEQDQPIHIVSDGGSENKGIFLEWLGGIHAPPIVSKVTARSDDFPFSNSMSEITHRLYKSVFMQGKLSLNKAEHLKDLATFFHEYNHQWYLGKNFGYTTTEVLQGKVPRRNRFRKQIKIAQKERLETNRNVRFCVPKLGCE